MAPTPSSRSWTTGRAFHATLRKGFSSLSPRSASRGGAGLGLAIARELARGMKGELELASNTDCGAVFRLRVPAAA